ncbi:MAG: glycosyltransferase family 4 protein, partial [Candidatus Saccharimonadales bacterium]
MKVAIVCDWLTGIGGAERVVLELHRMFPDAPIYTSQYDPSKIDWFKDADVRTTKLQTISPRLKKFLPLLRAREFSRLDLSGYDLVISSSGAEAKGVHTDKNTIHICYCHSPTHYY